MASLEAESTDVPSMNSFFLVSSTSSACLTFLCAGSRQRCQFKKHVHMHAQLLTGGALPKRPHICPMNHVASRGGCDAWTHHLLILQVPPVDDEVEDYGDGHDDPSDHCHTATRKRPLSQYCPANQYC
jgi:hypothetical protein